ncbi:DUF3237 domain-containing protein [Amycolatopsis magusensis]|uniref:DUF3237 domain-containing protein n=1 Tax=Amycolatopsis magusensis TaxID=882444 RepID=UPI0024A8E292|nr:DUF3237 domain-containing protein [Amycolatopsis magusensis]MDI5980801.1 DUF3237 domain-containing protein [Amycolatopsis magusensis]
MPDPTLTLIARLTVLIGEPVDAGPVPGGHRRIIPITGGTAEGPRIEGEVLPLGADWNLMRPDGVAEVSARYLVRTHDGVVLTITNEGSLKFDGVPRGITTPRIEAPADGPYAWLNDAVLVGTLTPVVDGQRPIGVSLEFHHAD